MKYAILKMDGQGEGPSTGSSKKLTEDQEGPKADYPKWYAQQVERQTHLWENRMD